ncbi:MAG: TlpA disulfide reductase family protein [Abditibacteriaceae bacterium]
MEKWKGVVIALIVVAIGGYGYLASRPSEPAAMPEKPPASGQDLQKMVGKPAPEFNIPSALWTVQSNSQHPVTVASLNGHVAIVEFWRATCPHCKDAAPFMESLYKKYQKQGLEVVGIQSPSNNPDPHFSENDWGQVRAIANQWGITYPIGFDAHAKLFQTKYFGTLYPTVLVLNKDGVVSYAESGYDDDKAKKLEQVVQQMLKTGTPEPPAVPAAHGKDDGHGH